MSESAFRGASAGATVFGIAVCPPAGAAAAQLAGGGTAAASSAGAVDTLVSVIPQIIGIEAAAEMLAQAGKAMLSKPPDGGDAAGGEEEGVYIENGEKVPEDINFDDKQLGKKWGKHKTDYPNMKDYTEYKQYARDVFDKPDKIIYDSKNQEYLYIKGDDLLRVSENGDFISLYDGAESARVTNAITEGGTLWP